ncbi:hypothetical protein BJ085DRAFT_40316 [Dimargaris cristalligena]|uniref:Uncharacterized protein n=1 Tax=Dimargaris cristalligena TaxID=215637 RepID=A0A4V1J4X3_9FUNG|nr:hypothetical protein BJ085DRAFT_40316 [Dimargaris cristalligena]|eukprot:RKP37059.1 hypothetical protein BJ085DRAFT_40316 [Dimargaris cristalligena]
MHAKYYLAVVATLACLAADMVDNTHAAPTPAPAPAPQPRPILKKILGKKNEKSSTSKPTSKTTTRDAGGEPVLTADPGHLSARKEIATQMVIAGTGAAITSQFTPSAPVVPAEAV